MAICRALVAKQARLAVMDEPTASLTPHSGVLQKSQNA